MARYKVARDYRTQTVGPWRKGDIVDVDDDVAAWVNADSPGCLVAASEKPKARAQKKPAKDRMARGGSDRGGAD